MGKRKQKTRWCSVSVDGLQWSQGEQQVSTSTECSAGVVAGSAVPGSGGGARRSSLAPRFERKAAAEAEKKHFYYEGEFCETEDLPNGFNKIRSKNLDILFKRDYYEQSLAAHLILAEKVKSSEHSIPAAVLEVEEEIKPTTTEIVDNMVEPDTAVKSSSWSFDHIDPNDIEEFKPMNSGVVSLSCDIDSDQTSPFYSSYPQYPDSLGHDASPHPHLYLYSPTDNSLIPCEEIIIPNPVMSPEGLVYSGPTNIYLAYPVQGPDGKGYITQPFATPGSNESYLSQDSVSYSPYDGINYYSTPRDSGSSTQPTSPPPLATYHPTNWINQDQPSLIHHVRDNIEGYYDPQPMLRPTDKSSPATSTTATGSTASSTTATYIPGLCLDSKRLNRKSQKKRKKKKVNSSLEHPSSSGSEPDILKLEAFDKNDEKGPEEVMEIIVPEVTAEPIHEVYLTDDLADSLVNPPTDPELSEEEVIKESFSVSITDQSAENSENNMDEKENFVENETVGGKRMSIKEFNEIEDKVGVSGPKENEEATVQDAIPMEIKDITQSCNADATKEDIADIQEEMSECDVHEEELQESVIKKVEQVKIINPAIVVAKKSPEVEKPKSKVRNRKPKRDFNLVLKPDIDSQVMKSEDESKASQAIKKSYSSVIKSNLVKESKNNPIIVSKPRVESVPTISPLPTISNCSAIQGNTVQESDNWEKVASKSSKPVNERKPSRKRRTKNQIMFEDSLMEDLSELKTVPQLDKCLNPKEVTEQTLHEAEPETVNLIDDIEIEKRTLRKKKKFGKDVSSTGHRVIISDDQISIRYSQAVRRASEVLSTSLLDTVKSSGYCNFLVIRELGSGISRGCMDYDRLYQGKYIPPDRTDGIPAWCEEESVKGERSDEEVSGENSTATASADIDLD